MSNIITRNLNGDEFVVSAQSDLNVELNGNQTLTLTVVPNKVNAPFINDIETMWEVDYFGSSYKVVYAKKYTRGNSFYVDVRAVHIALDRLDSIRTYERYDGSMTDTKAFNMVFEGTGYLYVLSDNFSSIQIEGFGDGETKLESFKRLLERFGAEFYIEGTTFYISKYIGRDTSFEYRYKLNVSDVQSEVDGTTTFTYVRGFGDYEESEQNVLEKAKIKRTYESPLAKILGRRHAPMVAKGSYKTTKAIDDAMKEVVDNSVVLSVSADVKDLRQQGYPYAQPELGDRVFLHDSRIGYNQEVRVVQITTERYANGNVRNINVVFGNQKLGRRYASNLSSAVSRLNALLNGSLQLEFDALDIRSKEMLRKIMSVDTELTLDNGIYAVDKNNPNNVVGLNSAGWFISKDGGNTAEVIATSDGITANAITSGVMLANRIHGGVLSSISGSMRIDLNNNRTDYYDGASTHYYGSSRIYFHTNDNALYQTNGETSAFLSFRTSLESTYPSISVGTSGNNGVDANSDVFSGVKIHTADALYNNMSRVEIIGDRLILDGDGSSVNTGGWTVEMSQSNSSNMVRSLYGHNQIEDYVYELGRNENRFEKVWMRKANDNLRFTTFSDGDAGVMDLDVKNGIKVGPNNFKIFYEGKVYDMGSILKAINFIS